jgi:hypothetical protein
MLTLELELFLYEYIPGIVIGGPNINCAVAQVCASNTGHVLFALKRPPRTVIIIEPT